MTIGKLSSSILRICILFPLWTGSFGQTLDDTSLHGTETRSANSEDRHKLVQLLEKKDIETVAAAAYALRQLGDTSPEVLSALKNNLDAGKNPEAIRSVSAFTLMSLGDAGKEILRQRITSSSSLLDRIAAVTALRANLAGLKDGNLREKMKSFLQEVHSSDNPDPLPTSDSPIKDEEFLDPGYHADWTFETSNGADGVATFDKTQSRRAGGSLKLEKFNAEGEISLRSVRPLTVKAGTTPTIRIYFRGDQNAPTSMLQLFLERPDGHLTIGDPLRGWVPLGQSVLFNSVSGNWLKRTLLVPKSDHDEEYYIRIMLRGNPATIWLDDIGAPAPPYIYAQTVPTETLTEAGNSTEPVNPSEAKVSQVGDRSRLLLDGNPVPPIFYTILRSSFGDYAGMEQLAKVRLLVVAVPFTDSADTRYPPAIPVWKKSGEFDFTTPLHWLEAAANKAPKSRFVVNLQFSWPKDWVDRHPQDAWQNQAGQRGYGTGIHLKAFADKLPAGSDARMPNIVESGFRWWPSPFSETALHDAEEGIQKFVSILKTKPYANRVIGVHISGGHDLQFMTSYWPDYSLPAIIAFRSWLKRRYSSDSALQSAWGDSSVTLATAEIPDFEKLPDLIKRRADLFLQAISDQRYIDHRRFQSEQGLVIRERLAEAFKKAWGRPAFAMTWQMDGGRGQGVDNLFLTSSGLDMLVPQPQYDTRHPGQVGGLRGAALASFALHGKLAIKELDLRTWLRMSGGELQSFYLGTAMNPLEFKGIFRREAAQMIAAGQGYWFFDIASNAFRDPEILETIAEGDRAYRELELYNPTPVRPDVAFVWVEESPYWMADYSKETGKSLGGGDVSILQTLEHFTLPWLKQAGVPYEDIYLDDLLKDPGAQKQYKVLIFPDAFRLSDAQCREIREKLERNRHTLVWNYAAGYIGDKRSSAEVTSELTGIQVKSETTTSLPKVRFAKTSDFLARDLSGIVGTGELSFVAMGGTTKGWKIPIGFHRFTITDPKAIPLASYQDGHIAIGVKRFPNWTSIYFGMLGTLDAKLLNRIAREAKALVLTDPVVAVEFNGRFLSLHGLRSGPVAVHLPAPSRVVDFDTGEEIGQGQDVSINLQAGDTRWFRVEPK